MLILNASCLVMGFFCRYFFLPVEDKQRKETRIMILTKVQNVDVDNKFLMNT